MATDFEGKIERLRLNPGDAALFRQIVTELRRAGRQDLVVDAIGVRATAAPDAEAARLWLAVGEVWANGNDDLRRNAFERAAERAAGQLSLFDEIERSAERLGEDDARRAVLRSRMRRGTPATRATAARKLATLCARLGDSAVEIEAWFTLGLLDANERATAVDRLAALSAAGHAEADARIEEIARGTGDDRLLLHVLDSRVRRGGRPSELVATYVELAQLAWRTSRDAEIAAQYLADAWGRAPSEAPRLLEATRTLAAEVGEPEPALISIERRLLEQLGDWPGACDALQRELGVTIDPSEQAEMTMRLGDLLATRIGDAESAIAQYSAAAQLDPALRGEVEQRLQQLATGDRSQLATAIAQARRGVLERAQDWGGLHEFLRDQVAAASGAERSRLLVELANLESARLGRPDLAVRTLGQAGRSAQGEDNIARIIEALFELASEPSARAEANAELGALLTDLERWSDLARFRRRQLEATIDADQRARLHYELGVLLADRLGRPDRAIDDLEAACDLRPNDTRYLEAARRLRMAAGQYDDALRLLVREAQASTDGTTRARLDAERAELLVRHLGQPAAAVEPALDALSAAPDDAQFRAVLRQALAGTGAVDAVEADARSRAATGDIRRASDRLWLAARELGLSSDDGARFGLMSAQLGPSESTRLGALKPAIEQRGVVEEQLVLYRILSETAPLGDERNAARTRRAGLELAAGNAAQAADLYRSLIATHPDDESLRLGLIAALEAQGDAGDLAAAIDAALTETVLTNETALSLLRKLVALYRDQLGRADLAIEALKRLLRVSPGDEDARATLTRLAAETGDASIEYAALAESLDEIDDVAVRVARELDLADIAAQRMGRVDLAAQHWLRVASDPDAPLDPRKRAAQHLVEAATTAGDTDALFGAQSLRLGLLDADEAGAEADALLDQLSDERRWELAFAAADAGATTLAHPSTYLLDRHAQLAARFEDWDRAISSLSRWFAREADTMPPDRVALLARLSLSAQPHADIGWQAAARTLCLDPEHPEVLAAVETVDNAARHAQIAEALGAADDDEATLDRLHVAAALLSLHPELSGECEAAYRRILSRAPNDRRAVVALADVIEAGGDSDAVRQTLEAQLDRADDEEVKVSILRRLVAMTEDDETREKWLLQILDLDLADTESRIQLVDIYRKQERFAELANLLDDLIELDEDEESRHRLIATLARIAQWQLQDKPRAAEALERLALEVPTDLTVLDRLEKIYVELDDQTRLASVLDRRAIYSDDIDARIDNLKRLAKIRETQLDDRDGALTANQRILDLEPANLPVLEEVGRLQAELGRWSDHLRTLERLANSTSIQELRAEVFVRAARVLHERVDRSREAIDLLAVAFETYAPEDAQVVLAREAGAAAEAWTTLAIALRHVALRLANPARAEMVAEIGLLVDEKCDDPAAALEWLSGEFRLAPGPGVVLDALESIATRRDVRTQLVDIYRLLATSTTDDEVLWHALSSSASIAEKELSRPDVAFDIMVRATQTPALKPRAEEQLERIAREHSLWDKHREWLGGQLEEPGDDPVALILRKVEVEEKQLGDWEAAFETIVGAFRDNPREPRLKAELLRLAAANNAWDYVLKLYELIQSGAAESERVGWLLEMSDLASTNMERPDLGFALHLRAFQLRPGDGELRDGLVERARSSGRLAELLAALEWDARRTELHDEREVGLRRVIALALELGQLDRAAAAWRQWIVLPGRAEAAIADADEQLSTIDKRPMLLEILERSSAEASDRALAVTLLTRRANLATELGSTDVAIESLQTALLDARDALALRRLLNVALESAGRFEALASSLEATLREPLEPAERESTALALADVQLAQLGSADRATATLQRCNRELPSSLPVRAALAARLRDAERWGELVELLLDPAASLEGADRSAALVDAATIAMEQLDDARRALRLVDQALETAPRDVAALETRARVLAALDRWSDHVDALVRWAEAADDDTAMRAFGEAASVVESRMFVPTRALELWRRAAASSPEAGQPWAEISRIALTIDDAPTALDAARRAISGLTASDAPAREVAAAHELLAQSLEASGSDAREVADALTRAVELDPRNARARQALESALEKAGGVEKLLSLLDDELQQARTDAERARVLLRRAMVLFFDAKNERDALLNAQRAAEIAPDLARAAAALRGDFRFAQERWTDAAAEYATAFASGDDFDVVGLVRTRRLVPGEEADSDLGAVAATRYALAVERGGEPERAWDLFAEANVADDAYAPALLGLARLSIASGNPSGAQVHVRTLLSAGTGIAGEILAEARKLSARVAEATGDHTAAIDALEAEAASSGDIASLERAVEVARRHGETSRLIELLPQLAAKTEDSEVRARTQLEIGELLLAEGGRRDEALAQLEAAVAAAPESSRIPERALRIVVERCEEHDAITLIDGWLSRTTDPTRRGAMLLTRAALRQAAEGKVTAEAAADFAAALAAVPHSATALEQTVRAHESLGDFGGLATALTSALLACPRELVAPRGQILRALGNVQLRRLDDIDGARMTFEELRLMFPTDVAVLESLLEIYEHEEINAGDDALGVAAELVRQGALSDDLLRSLEHLYFSADNIDGVVQVLAVLRLAGAATDDEKAVLASIPLHAPDFEPGQLSAVYDELLTPSGFDADAATLIAAATRQWVASNTERFVRPTDAPAADSPIAIEFARLTRAFGLEGASLGVDAEQDRPVRVLPLEPPAVVVSIGFAEEDDIATLRFELARALVRARPEFVVTDALGPIDYLGFIEAVFANATSDAASLDEGLARQVGRWSDQIGPLALGNLARRPRDRFPSVGAWREFIQTATIRTGVLACFDSAAAFDRLLIESDESTPHTVEQLRDLCSRNSAVRELVTFALSDTYLAARRRLGLVVGRS